MLDAVPCAHLGTVTDRDERHAGPVDVKAPLYRHVRAPQRLLLAHTLVRVARSWQLLSSDCKHLRQLRVLSRHRQKAGHLPRRDEWPPLRHVELAGCGCRHVARNHCHSCVPTHRRYSQRTPAAGSRTRLPRDHALNALHRAARGDRVHGVASHAVRLQLHPVAPD
eukprot:1904335-Prymnesium_polylepis.2